MKRIAVLWIVPIAWALTSAAERSAPRDAADHAHNQLAAGAKRTALARIEPLGESKVRGTAEFRQVGDEVVLEIRVTGGAPGSHAMHIHEFGNCDGADGSTAGQHWNPDGHDHGAHAHHAHGSAHRGDIGNIEIGADGVGKFVLKTVEWSVGEPDVKNVLGKSIIIHAGPDDFATQPGGQAGDRIACGVIQAQR